MKSKKVVLFRAALAALLCTGCGGGAGADPPAPVTVAAEAPRAEETAPAGQKPASAAVEKPAAPDTVSPAVTQNLAAMHQALEQARELSRKFGRFGTEVQAISDRVAALEAGLASSGPVENQIRDLRGVTADLLGKLGSYADRAAFLRQAVDNLASSIEQNPRIAGTSGNQ